MIEPYPRLPADAAGTLLAELTLLAVAGSDGLRVRSGLSHPRAEWYPTAARQPSERLVDIATTVRAIAEQHGFPRPLVQRSDPTRRFDQAIATALLDIMHISPVDASEDGVWSFLSLVVLPDVAFWRWPNRGSRTDYERLIGRPRNVFRRLWWRAYTLGPAASGALLEDEAVAIMERPTLGGDPRLARLIAEDHLRGVAAFPETSRTELLRQVAKRLRRMSTVVTFAALGDTALTELIAEVSSAARRALDLGKSGT